MSANGKHDRVRREAVLKKGGVQCRRKATNETDAAANTATNMFQTKSARNIELHGHSA
jgi:hypothetical protein